MSKSSKPKTFHYPVEPGIREDDGPWYVIEDDVVTWRGYETEADPGTFVALTNAWGVDRESVYIQDRRKRRIDRDTFRLLNPLFAVDNHAVYDWSGPLKPADPQTFVALDAGVVADGSQLISEINHVGYGRDKHGIWFHDQMCGRATLIKSANRESFRSYGNGYGADESSVFYGKAKLAKSDPQSWLYLGHGYSMDYRRVWFLNREIKEAARDNFFAINLPGAASLATDGVHYFSNCTTITQSEFDKQVASRLKARDKQAKRIRVV